MTPLLEARSLQAWHGRRRVVAPCSIEVARGETFGVYGPNGAGKSTLLQALAHLHPHVDGELLFEGRIVGREMSKREYRRRAAVVFQQCLLLEGTVLDNVALGLALRGIDRLERERRARRWLERLRVPHLASRRAHGLSGGEAQRVSLARAFALEPDVIFLDEPFSALDAPTRETLVDDLGGILGENGTTTVFVTHDPDELRDLCARCLILDEGQALQMGPVEELFDRPRTRRVAEIVGADNIVAGVVTSADDQGAWVDWDGESIRVPGLAAKPGTNVALLLAPDALDVRLPPAAVPAGAIAGTIARTRRRGRDFLLTVRLQNGHTLRALSPAGNHAPGANAILVPRRDAFWCMDPAHAAAPPAPAPARDAERTRGSGSG